VNLLDRIRERFAKRQLDSTPAPYTTAGPQPHERDPFPRDERRRQNRQRERSRAVTRSRGATPMRK
jgi:hypothetical protein